MIVLLFVSEYPGKFLPSEIEESVHTQLENDGYLSCYARGGGKPLYDLTPKAKALFVDDRDKTVAEMKEEMYPELFEKEKARMIREQKRLTDDLSK